MKRLPVLAAVAATAVAGAAVLTGTATADAAQIDVHARALDTTTQTSHWVTSADLGTFDGVGEPPVDTGTTAPRRRSPRRRSAPRARPSADPACSSTPPPAAPPPG